jgi:hypothetical protein
MSINKPITWVVYQRAKRTNSKELVANSVCEQTEWDVILSLEPTVVTLVQAGFIHEPEAEKYARGTAGEHYKRGWASKPRK